MTSMLKAADPTMVLGPSSPESAGGGDGVRVEGSMGNGIMQGCSGDWKLASVESGRENLDSREQDLGGRGSQRHER